MNLEIVNGSPGESVEGTPAVAILLKIWDNLKPDRAQLLGKKGKKSTVSFTSGCHRWNRSGFTHSEIFVLADIRIDEHRVYNSSYYIIS